MKPRNECPQNLDMPVPCSNCDKWIELNDSNFCWRCNDGFCGKCLNVDEHYCKSCSEELEAMDD